MLSRAFFGTGFERFSVEAAVFVGLTFGPKLAEGVEGEGLGDERSLDARPPPPPPFPSPTAGPAIPPAVPGGLPVAAPDPGGVVVDCGCCKALLEEPEPGGARNGGATPNGAA